MTAEAVGAAQVGNDLGQSAAAKKKDTPESSRDFSAILEEIFQKELPDEEMGAWIRMWLAKRTATRTDGAAVPELLKDRLKDGETTGESRKPGAKAVGAAADWEKLLGGPAAKRTPFGGVGWLAEENAEWLSEWIAARLAEGLPGSENGEGEGKGSGGKLGKTGANGEESVSAFWQTDSEALVNSFPADEGGRSSDDGLGAVTTGAANRGSKGSRSRLVVVDLRTDKTDNAADSVRTDAVNGKRAGTQTADARTLGLRPGDSRQGGSKSESLEEVRFFTRSLSEHRFGMDQAKETAVPAAKQPLERFQELLKNQVVKHSTIILKENGGGELRLILKPESLGRVRISLNLDNNHIAGRIIVENSSVKDIFESNLQNMQNAFKNEGYASAHLEVSVGSGSQNREDPQKGTDLPKNASWEAASEFEKSVPTLLEPLGGDWIVNLTV